MKTKLSLTASALLTALLSTPIAQAANGCLTAPDENITKIYFANGVANTEADALHSLAYIKSAYRWDLADRDDERYEFNTAYNYTQGAVADIIQVFKQKKDEVGLEGINAEQLLWLIWRQKTSVDFVKSAIRAMTDIPNPDAIADRIDESVLAELFLTIEEKEAAVISDRERVNAAHESTYNADLISGKRVIVFAHSQGNLFTNEAVRTVILGKPERAKSIGVVNIATPANSVVNQSPYVTAHDDRVIDALRVLQPVLESNLDNDLGLMDDNRDWLNHSFLPGYFDQELPSRAVIDDAFWSYVDNLPYPGIEAGEGAIRASLTWGEQKDVDLHAFEPNGSHVYYVNTTGVSGKLDVDDRSQYGPENYVVACEDVELGTYEIGLNYFAGSAPANAKISIFLGNNETVTPKTVTLSEPLGRSGDANPQILFRVNVSEDESGQITYDVE